MQVNFTQDAIKSIEEIVSLLKCVHSDEKQDPKHFAEILGDNYSKLADGFIFQPESLTQAFILFDMYSDAVMGIPACSSRKIEVINKLQENPIQHARQALFMFSAGARHIGLKLMQISTTLANTLNVEMGNIQAEFIKEHCKQRYFEPDPNLIKTYKDAFKLIIEFYEERFISAMYLDIWDMSALEFKYSNPLRKHSACKLIRVSCKGILENPEKEFDSNELGIICHDTNCIGLILKAYSKETLHWQSYLMQWIQLPLAMALHHRLGKESKISCLTDDLILYIIDIVNYSI